MMAAHLQLDLQKSSYAISRSETNRLSIFPSNHFDCHITAQKLDNRWQDCGSHNETKRDEMEISFYCILL